jgi:hypothetical protein
MRYRFVTSDSPFSMAIRTLGPTSRPFTPSHVEVVVDGWPGLPGQSGYLGAHSEGGVLVRPVGYDKASLLVIPDYGPGELFVDVPMPHEDEAQAYAISRIGHPYDWAAILDFVSPGLLPDQAKHLICSAFGARIARLGDGLPYPLPALAHSISPAMLLNIFGGFINVLR